MNQQPFSQSVVGFVLLGVIVTVVGGLMFRWITGEVSTRPLVPSNRTATTEPSTPGRTGFDSSADSVNSSESLHSTLDPAKSVVPTSSTNEVAVVSEDDLRALEEGRLADPAKQRLITGGGSLEEWLRLRRIARYSDVPGYGLMTMEEFNNLPVEAKQSYWTSRDNSDSEKVKASRRRFEIVGNLSAEQERQLRTMTPRQRSDYIDRLALR